MIVRSLIATLFLFVAASNANAQDSQTENFWRETLGASVSLRQAIWFGDRDFGSESDYVVPSAWLTLRPKDYQGTHFFFDGMLWNQDAARSGSTWGEVREAYADRTLGSFDLRIGRQVIIWGRADKVNPTDNLSVRDYTRLVIDDEEQRKGVLSTQLTYNFEQSRLTWVWLPEWREPQFPFDESAVSSRVEEPDDGFEQWALKYDTSGGEVDWSLSYYQGYDKAPDLTYNGSDVILVHNKIRVLGGDFARTIGDYGLRGELAYNLTADDEAKDVGAKNSFWFGVFGIERSFFEHLNVNFQLILRKIDNFEEPVGAFAKTAALVTNQDEETLIGDAIRISYSAFNDTLVTEIAYIGYPKHSTTRPKVTYQVNDNMKLIAGAEFYSGESDTFFGRLKANNTSYFEIRYSF
jgi:hypothetical protein